MYYKDEQKMYIKCQIKNVLKGDALRTIEDRTTSPEQKIVQMEVIEEFKKYIDNYDENIKLIKQAKIYNERIEDDLR